MYKIQCHNNMSCLNFNVSKITNSNPYKMGSQQHTPNPINNRVHNHITKPNLHRDDKIRSNTHQSYLKCNILIWLPQVNNNWIWKKSNMKNKMLCGLIAYQNALRILKKGSIWCLKCMPKESTEFFDNTTKIFFYFLRFYFYLISFLFWNFSKNSFDEVNWLGLHQEMIFFIFLNQHILQLFKMNIFKFLLNKKFMLKKFP